MSEGRITLGFKPEVLEAVRPSRRPALRPALQRAFGLLAAVAIVLAGLALGTDIEDFLLPRTVILRGNRLTPATEVLELAGLPGKIGLRSLLPQARKVTEGKSRWVKGYRTSSLVGRRMLLSVDERMPVLPLEMGSNPYWICSDGEIIPRRPEQDVDGHFKQLNRLPLVDMAGSGIDAEYDVADMLMQTAACCRELMDGRIKRIKVSQGGDVNLVTDRGLLVQLGIPDDTGDLSKRMTALAKAIRISDEYKDATGIDMRNGKVAYLRTGKSE